MIDYLKWDSDFFKAKIGKVNTSADYSIKQILLEKEKQHYDRVYLFSPQKLDSGNGLLLLVDEKVTFTKQLENKSYPSKFTNNYQGSICKELINLSLLSGHKSRFKVDPFFAPHFERLYTAWLTNSLNKQFADTLLIATVDNNISGFVTIKAKNKTASIGLIAVDNEQQGLGLGKDLLGSVENWCRQKNIKTLNVVTQLNNQQACYFYKAFGYTQKNIVYIYHL